MLFESVDSNIQNFWRLRSTAVQWLFWSVPRWLRLGIQSLGCNGGNPSACPPMMNACTWQMQWVSSSTVFGLLSENDSPRWATFHKNSRHLKKCCQPWGKVERCWEWCCWFCHGFCSLSFFIQPESLLRSRSPRTCSLFWMPTFLRCRERAPKAGDRSWHSWCHWRRFLDPVDYQLLMVLC